MRKIIFLLSITLHLSFAFAPGAKAQTSQNSHQHAPAVNTQSILVGDSIQDNHAYLLWFNVVSYNDGTATSIATQDALINKIPLASKDKLLLLTALNEYRTKHDALVSSYNEQAKSSAPVAFASLLADLVALVNQTRTTINQGMTAAGVAALHQHVLDEKSTMRVPASWSGQ